jgi:hypothetical protein
VRSFSVARWCQGEHGGGPLLPDDEGFVGTGQRAVIKEDDVARSLRLIHDAELLHHGGFTIAASELDGLYQAFPGFLDAACFALPDPLLGDRISPPSRPSRENPSRSTSSSHFSKAVASHLTSSPTGSSWCAKSRAVHRAASSARRSSSRFDAVQAACLTALAILTSRFSNSRAPSSRSSDVCQLP